MIEIDGGDGGGQVLRTALSLSALTDTPLRVENVRGARPDPGLKPQHLAAVTLLADFCDATVEGAEVGSETVTFRPGESRQPSLDVAVDTAGSVTLVLDTLLPVAATAGEPVAATATGGTNVKWSPTVEYVRHVKLPLLATAGLDADLSVARRGFYPTGGGEVTLRTRPSSLSSLELDSRGALERVEVYSTASAGLAGADVAERQADRAADRLGDAGLAVAVCRTDSVETDSPGSSLLVRGVYEESVVGSDELGERGKPSEAVADDAVDRFLECHGTAAAVDRYMADQAVVFLALAGGRVRLPAVTDHVETNLDVVDAFGSDVRLARESGTPVLVASAHPNL